MRALVTGAAGFIGRHAVPGLAEEGWEVTALDLHGPGPAKGSFVEGDIRDTDTLRRHLSGMDAVVHLASAHLEVGRPESWYRSINVEALGPLLRAARDVGVRHFVHTSSVGVHGSLRVIPGDEDADFRPENLYERTKAEGEAVVRSFAQSEAGEMGVTIVRPAWVYGAGDHRTEKILRTVARGLFVFFGPGRNRRHPIHVRDCVRGVADLLLEPSTYGETYILAGPEYLSSAELIATAERVTGGRVRLRAPLAVGHLAGAACELAFAPLRRDPPMSRRTLSFFTNENAFDIARARRDFGFEPAIGFEAGLRQVWEEVGP